MSLRGGLPRLGCRMASRLINFRVHENVRARLVAMAEARGQDFSEFMRGMVNDFLIPPDGDERDGPAVAVNCLGCGPTETAGWGFDIVIGKKGQLFPRVKFECAGCGRNCTTTMSTKDWKGDLELSDGILRADTRVHWKDALNLVIDCAAAVRSTGLAERNRVMCELAAKGATAEQLAALMRLEESTVNRITSAARAAAAEKRGAVTGRIRVRRRRRAGANPPRAHPRARQPFRPRRAACRGASERGCWNRRKASGTGRNRCGGRGLKWQASRMTWSIKGRRRRRRRRAFRSRGLSG